MVPFDKLREVLGQPGALQHVGRGVIRSSFEEVNKHRKVLVKAIVLEGLVFAAEENHQCRPLGLI
jgi:hypothetical protein